MEPQDVVVKETREADMVKQQHEVERLTAALKDADERAKVGTHLMRSVVGTVTALGKELGSIANEAFELTDSVETLVARTQRVMSELHYVQTEAETGQMDTGAAKLLSRQLRDIAAQLDLQVEQATDVDIDQMRSRGEDERREVEDRRRRHENERRTIEDERRQKEDSIFDDEHRGMA